MPATFQLPDGLAPEVYPLAWLVGSWRGYGLLAYPGVDEQPFVHELTFDHDGGPYLRSESTLWSVADTGVQLGAETVGVQGAAQLTPTTVWSTETAYWRVVPTPETPGDDQDAARGDRAASDDTELEVLAADPAGHLSVYLGRVRGARIDLSTDAVVRTPSAASVTGATRMYGLVEGELLWAYDLAAFGHRLQSYASGRLSRIQGTS